MCLLFQQNIDFVREHLRFAVFAQLKYLRCSVWLHNTYPMFKSNRFHFRLPVLYSTILSDYAISMENHVIWNSFTIRPCFIAFTWNSIDAVRMETWWVFVEFMLIPNRFFFIVVIHFKIQSWFFGSFIILSQLKTPVNCVVLIFKYAWHSTFSCILPHNSFFVCLNCVPFDTLINGNAFYSLRQFKIDFQTLIFKCVLIIILCLLFFFLSFSLYFG